MKENCLRKEDFDRYIIPLPLSKIAGKSRKKYLFSELEKRHPCFSNEFCFDSKLILGKKGFLSDVIVMNKMKLAGYDRKNGLMLEKGGVTGRKRCFVPEWKNYIVYGGVAFLLLAGIVVSGIIRKKTSIEVEKPEVTEDRLASPLILEEEAPDQVVYDFFKSVEEENGLITGLQWKIEGFTETLSANISSMVPDKLISKKKSDKVKLSAVSFANGQGEFSYSIWNKRSGENYLNIPEQISGQESGQVFGAAAGDGSAFDLYFPFELRNFLAERKCGLMQESYEPFIVKFSVSDFEVFRGIVELLKKSGEKAQITSFILSKSSEKGSGFFAEIKFEEGLPEEMGLNLKILADYEKLFRQKRGLEDVKQPVKNQNKKNRDWEFVGEVRHGDGGKVIFYKNENGKIVKEVENG